jgi:hypothetical protein
MCSSSSFPLVTTPGPKPKPLTLEDLRLPGEQAAFCCSAAFVCVCQEVVLSITVLLYLIVFRSVFV